MTDNNSQNWRPAKPLDDMDYLDGYLDYHYNDDEASNGAWFVTLQCCIAEHWEIDIGDALDPLIEYLKWKGFKEKPRA